MKFNPTASEYVAWQFLKARRLGASFKRQQVIGEVIVDFLAPKLKLVVEVDGGYHEQTARADARRDRALGNAGYRVLRLSAAEVLTEPRLAAARVLLAVRECGG